MLNNNIMYILGKALRQRKHKEGQVAWYICGSDSFNGHPWRPVLLTISEWCFICSILIRGKMTFLQKICSPGAVSRVPESYIGQAGLVVSGKFSRIGNTPDVGMVIFSNHSRLSLTVDRGGLCLIVYWLVRIALETT